MKRRRRKQNREEMRAKKREAATLRKAHGLCPCEDEVKAYDSREEAAADEDTPPTFCPTCGLPRLRVQAIHKPGYPSVTEQVARLR